MNKVILHVDMDAFFASVEQMDNKDLKGKPVIVGGTSERGVVSTCSYEARKYGVHSAMPAFIARQKCPNGVFVRVRYWRYKEISEEIFRIFRTITEKVQVVSIDEAYLDLGEIPLDEGYKIALYIKRKVFDRFKLTLSIGISYNKFLAKLASDWNKPNGIKIISEDLIPEILFPLQISKVHGLGSRSVAKLNNLGVFTIEELYHLDRELLVEVLGKQGIEVSDRIRGIDNREVQVERERKSLGKETTLRTNTNDIDEIKEILKSLTKEVSDLLIKRNIKGKTVTLKYKKASFENHTRSKTIQHYTNKFEDIYTVVIELLMAENLDEEWRLMGVTVSSLKEEGKEQISFFE